MSQTPSKKNYIFHRWNAVDCTTTTYATCKFHYQIKAKPKVQIQQVNVQVYAMMLWKVVFCTG